MQRIHTPPPIPDRPKTGHKGLFGRVLIVGGNDTMLGAPVMSGTAALRMGAGLVQIAIPRAILAAALSVTPELIGLALGNTATPGELREAAEKADAIVVGPGLGQSKAAHDRLMRLITLDKAMVIDADGLNMLAAGKRWPKTFKAKAVLTPHPGEMRRLERLLGKSPGKPLGVDSVPTDDDGRIELATKAARTFEKVIVLKGDRTVVADGERVYVNHTGDSSLSKAGSGDVLSGMIGTLLGQKMDPFDAACAGVHLHGRAGEIAGEHWGRRSVLAMDVIDEFPQAIEDYVKEFGVTVVGEK